MENRKFEGSRLSLQARIPGDGSEKQGWGAGAGGFWLLGAGAA